MLLRVGHLCTGYIHNDKEAQRKLPFRQGPRGIKIFRDPIFSKLSIRDSHIGKRDGVSFLMINNVGQICTAYLLLVNLVISWHYMSRGIPSVSMKIVHLLVQQLVKVVYAHHITAFLHQQIITFHLVWQRLLIQLEGLNNPESRGYAYCGWIWEAAISLPHHL